MDDHADTLRRGWQLHQQGSHTEAEALYRLVLTSRPRSAAALYCYGRLAFDVGELAVAADYLAQAVAADRTQAIYYADLAQTFQALGRHDEAVAGYRRAVELEPGRADVYVNLGNTFLQSGRADEAVATYRRALECDPMLADAHSCLGAVLEQQGHIEEAEACYRRAIELRPDYAQAHFNLGTILKGRNRPAEALPWLRRATELAPKSAATHHNLGTVLRILEQPADAKQAFERSLALNWQQPWTHLNLGDMLEEQGQPEAALAHFENALGVDPKYPEGRYGRGTILLKLGRYREGWKDYEFRIGLPQFDTLSFPQPTWDGSPLGERTLLIHCEQGFGDTFQFFRFIKLARQRTSKIVVAARPELIPLLARSGCANLVSKHALPAFDVHAPLMSLPRILDIELETLPREVPYMAADSELVESWRAKLSTLRGFRIGIHWQGNSIFVNDRFRSIPLGNFGPLARVPGVTLVALQKGPGSEQVAAAARQCPIHDLGPELDETSGAFMDTAAIMRNLDLVITSDTSAAHLAGALGVNVWVALANVAEWRWLLDREDSPWYPTMRLFRQRRQGEWAEVFERMAAELARTVSKAPGNRPADGSR